MLVNDDFEMGKLGIIFIYTLPMISLMFLVAQNGISFYGVKFYSLLLYLLQNQAPGNFIRFIHRLCLPLIAYLHGLLFLFFNLCLPLAAARIFSTLKRSAGQLSELNQNLAQSHNYYEELFEHNGSATVLVTASGDIIKSNSLACEVLGLQVGQQANLLSLLKFCAGQSVTRALAERQSGVQGQKSS